MKNRKKTKKDISLITDRHYRRLIETEKKKCCNEIFSSLTDTLIEDNNNFTDADESSNKILISTDIERE